MKINLPNKLTIARVILCPFFMIFIIYPIPNEVWSRIIAAALFILAAVTDFVDGKIARKKHLITNFGKFLDPLADKFMVIGALICFCVSSTGNFSSALFKNVIVWTTIIVVFRELGVTSLRLLVSKESGVVVAASKLGKLKTVSQCVCICMILLEPIIFPESIPAFHTWNILSYLMIAIMLSLTLWSGAKYVKSYWGFLDPTK
ncbi:MAG TPA: CDP-diacylglycerol--glycerol-3-phosphate 3-phosphatidyltransferase [Bacillota bacterium]|nr:CDP-diacylglycerol--glycerol-3-phosphate 3-phosphatidyltransferase [Bacillota bacterium]